MCRTTPHLESIPPKFQRKSSEGGAPRGKIGLRLSTWTPQFPSLTSSGFENAASFGSPEVHLSEPGDPKVTWLTSSHGKVDPWRVYSQDSPDLDMVAHALTGRRGSAPVSVSAVRTSFMVKMCQARAVPVIPPKIQYTQIPQPLPSQSSEESGAPALERNQEEAGSTGGTSQKLTKMILSPPWKAPGKKSQSKIQEPLSPCQWVPLHLSCEGPCSPEPGLANLLPTQEALAQCRSAHQRQSHLGTTFFLQIERSSGVLSLSLRSRPGRPQSLILFSPPFPIMDHPPPSSTGTDSKVLLSPIKKSTQTISPGLLCGELAETHGSHQKGLHLGIK